MNGIKKQQRHVVSLAVIVTLVLVVPFVSGCGGKSASSTTTTSATEQWANGLCAATNTYLASLKSMTTTLKGGDVSKSSLDAVASDAKTSTQAFADSVKALGEPPVSDSQSKQIFQTLQSELQKDADAIKNATSDVSGLTGVLNAVSVVAATLATAGTQITNAYSQVSQLDAKDEVQQAFKDAPACASLMGS